MSPTEKSIYDQAFLDKLKNVHDVSFDCMIAVATNEEITLVGGDVETVTNVLDGESLNSVLSLKDKESLTSEPGIYRCKIIIISSRSNHPEDPEEWDLDIRITDVKPAIPTDEEIRQKWFYVGDENKDAAARVGATWMKDRIFGKIPH